MYPAHAGRRPDWVRVSRDDTLRQRSPRSTRPTTSYCAPAHACWTPPLRSMHVANHREETSSRTSRAAVGQMRRPFTPYPVDFFRYSHKYISSHASRRCDCFCSCRYDLSIELLLDHTLASRSIEDVDHTRLMFLPLIPQRDPPHPVRIFLPAQLPSPTHVGPARTVQGAGPYPPGY